MQLARNEPLNQIKLLEQGCFRHLFQMPHATRY